MNERQRLERLFEDGDHDATAAFLRLLEREGDALALDAARALISQRAQAAFDVVSETMPFDAPRFRCEGVSHVEGVGLVARLSYYGFKPSYRSCGGEFLLAPTSQLGDWSRVVDAVLARVARWRADPAASDAALDGDPEAVFGARLIDPEEIGARPISEVDQARISAALEASLARHEVIAAQFKTLYGLRLPRHLAVFHAMYQTMSPLEARAMSYIGLRPGGILLAYDAEGGLERPTRDGLDGRLEGRFRCDPPEMVMTLWGDSDGLHFGLWYDDPAELPTCIAANYARDDAETYDAGGPTLRAMVLERIDELDDPEGDWPPVATAALVRWLGAFEAADREALEADGPIRWEDAERHPWIGGMSPALSPEHAADGLDDRRSTSDYRDTPDQVAAWARAAREALAEGRAGLALRLGRELHWIDSDEHRALGEEMFIAAYELLGREALAEIVRVHYRHRDLRSVGVYL